MRKNEKTSNNTNTLKNKKIEQKSNTRKSISSQEDEIEKNIVIRRSTGREEKFDTNRLAKTSSRRRIKR
jgi:hypothetical protein